MARLNIHTTTHTCTLMSTSSCGILSLLFIVKLPNHNAGQLPLHSSGNSHANVALFSLQRGLRVHISVIRLLCSAVLQLWWHLGVAPLFLTVSLPTLVRLLVVSQDRGLCVSPHFLCTHAHWMKVLLEKKIPGNGVKPPLKWLNACTGFLCFVLCRCLR